MLKHGTNPDGLKRIANEHKCIISLFVEMLSCQGKLK